MEAFSCRRLLVSSRRGECNRCFFGRWSSVVVRHRAVIIAVVVVLSLLVATRHVDHAGSCVANMMAVRVRVYQMTCRSVHRSRCRIVVVVVVRPGLPLSPGCTSLFVLAVGVLADLVLLP